jgi:hypothetical protein
MAGGGGAKRQAAQAAEQSRAEAAAYRIETANLQRKTDAASAKAQRVLMRSLRARGGGFFESDAPAALGGGANIGAGVGAGTLG